MGTAIAKRTATAVKYKPIADVVRQIKTHIHDAATSQRRADKHRLQAGQLLLQLRQRIESGEEGNGIDWWPWCEQHIERSRKDCEKLMRIASAEDPEQALEDERERVRLAVADHRARKKAAADVTVTSKPDADEPPLTVTMPEPDADDDADDISSQLGLLPGEVVTSVTSPCGEFISHRLADGSYRMGGPMQACVERCHGGSPRAVGAAHSQGLRPHSHDIASACRDGL